MGEVKLIEEIYRVVGILPRRLIHGEVRERVVWRYRSKPDAIWRAQELDIDPDSELVEFSRAEVNWEPVPSSWWQ